MKLPAHPKPDEAWCDLIASFAAEELVAAKLITLDRADFAQRIIAQQAYVLLVSNTYPAGDLNRD